MSIEIHKYSSDKKNIWDAFIRESKNATFLFYRDYMEYHSDRFVDYSLMIYDQNKLIALLPASLHGNELRSHGGLTYGGILTNQKIKSHSMLDIFTAISGYLKNDGLEKLVYKTIPYIYHSYPADEDLYALFRNSAQLVRRDISSCVEKNNKPKLNSKRRNDIQKSLNNGVTIEESRDFDAYFSVLETVLMAKYDKKPVHTADEMKALADSFPKSIRLFLACRDSEVISGVLVYETSRVAHLQYMANTDLGRQYGALDAIVYHLIYDVYAEKDFLDFGISTEDNGQYLNEGLAAQKEKFGGRGIVYDTYEISL